MTFDLLYISSTDDKLGLAVRHTGFTQVAYPTKTGLITAVPLI